MFNLEMAIADWRRQMADGGLTDLKVLDELEAHLREDLAARMGMGEDGEGAFRAAVRRLGSSSALTAEFVKSGGGPRPSLFWVAWARGLTWLAGLAYFWILLMGVKALFHAETSLLERVLGATAVGLTPLSPWMGRLLYQFVPALRGDRARRVFQWACLGSALVWMALYGLVVVPRLDFPVLQMFVLTLWTICLPGMAIGLARGLDPGLAGGRRWRP